MLYIEELFDKLPYIIDLAFWYWLLTYIFIFTPLLITILELSKEDKPK